MHNDSKEQMFEIIHSLSKVVENYNYYLQMKLGFRPNYPYKDEQRKGLGEKHVGHYPFIPTYKPATLLQCLCEVRDYIRKKRGRDPHNPSLSFLDCGCGIGNIMLLARSIDGYGTVAGIEYDNATHRVAQELLPYNEDITRGDLINFNGYGNFDVIYYYEPISCQEKSKIFYKKLISGMKVGAVIIPNGNSYLFREDPMKRFKQLSIDCRTAYEKVEGTGTKQQED